MGDAAVSLKFPGLVRSVVWSLVVLASNLAAAPEHPVYEVPRLNSFTPDGNDAEWGDTALRVDMLAVRDLPRPAFADFAPSLRLGWTEKGLAVLVVVQDDVIHEDANQIASGDSVEVFLAGGTNSTEYFQLLLRPNLGGLPVTQLVDRRTGIKGPVPVMSAAVRIEGGYRVEMLLPWESVGLQPSEGGLCAFSIQVNDVDRPGQDRRMATWYPVGWASAGPQSMHWLKLGTRASAVSPVAFSTAWRIAEGTAEVVAWAPANLAGTAVEVREGSNLLVAGRFVIKDGVCEAKLAVPLPPVGTDWPASPDIVVNGMAQSLLLGSPERERTKTISRLEVEFEAYVFAGQKFPRCRFTDTLLADRVLGHPQLEVMFFDAAYNPVTEARVPGRHGALVIAKRGDKEVLRRKITLFRMASEIDWNKFTPKDNELPAELGFAPDRVARQTESLGDLLRDGIRHELTKTMGGALFLAALTDLGENGGPFSDRTRPWRLHQNWWYGLSKKMGEPGLPHIVMLPKHYEAEPDRKWPLILCLHGAGGRGNDVNSLRNGDVPVVAASKKDFPFIVLSPQCAPSEWWFPAPLLDLLDDVGRKYRVDPDRVYVTGASMGGYGTWALLAEAPERFAAAAPICGGGDLKEVERFSKVPVWAFHGTKDRTVRVERSRELIAALRKLGAPVALTEYPEAGHNSWDATYRDDRLYGWFLANRRGSPVKPPVE